MARQPRAGKNEEPAEQPPKIEDARASLMRVLHENEELERELTRVREGNLRAAEILARPLLPPQPQAQPGGPAGGVPPQAVATAAGAHPPGPQQPPPPEPGPPKRPRLEED